MSEMTDSDVTTAAQQAAQSAAKGRPADATHSARPPRGGKRELLVTAAARMLYEQGVEATTLADIAQAAGIPVGNVYYYFRTRNDIITAVIEEQERDIQRQLDEIEARFQQPQERLRALFGALGGQGEAIAKFGCPQGSLCQELGKQAASAAALADGPLVAVPDASRLITLPMDWIERQFTVMGRPDARALAIQTVGAYEGAALLTNVLRDPDLLEREARRIADWIDSLSAQG
jgi:TetR/AcrR family transcriptional regulator, transcriptional repressor for nem operon